MQHSSNKRVNIDSNVLPSELHANLTQSGNHFQQYLNASFAGYLKSEVSKRNFSIEASQYKASSETIQSRYYHGNRASPYAFGSGDFGYLGFGMSDPATSEEKWAPEPKVIHYLSKRKDVRILVCGGESTALVDEEGLWTWGNNDGFLLGRGGNENLPALVTFPFKVILISVSLGDSHGAAVSLDGHAYLWGTYRDKEGKNFFPNSNFSFQNWLGQDTWAESPIQFMLNDIIQVCSGENHTLFLDCKETMYSCGLGEVYQLGREVDVVLKDPQTGEYKLEMIYNQHLIPQACQDVKHVVGMGAGENHSFVLTRNFSVFGCGLNNYDQILPKPQPLELIVKNWSRIKSLDSLFITQITGSGDFSLALSSLTGKVYSWGRAKVAGLGLPESISSNKEIVSCPTLIPDLPSDVCQISCQIRHALVCTKSGEAYSWGQGDMFMLGHGDENDVHVPKKIKSLSGKRVLKVNTGGHFSCVLVSNEEDILK